MTNFEKFQEACELLYKLGIKDGDQIAWTEFDRIEHGKVIGEAMGGQPSLSIGMEGYSILAICNGKLVKVLLSSVVK